jgi:hypothetical protein
MDIIPSALHSLLTIHPISTRGSGACFSAVLANSLNIFAHINTTNRNESTSSPIVYNRSSYWAIVVYMVTRQIALAQMR